MGNEITIDEFDDSGNPLAEWQEERKAWHEENIKPEVKEQKKQLMAQLGTIREKFIQKANEVNGREVYPPKTNSDVPAFLFYRLGISGSDNSLSSENSAVYYPVVEVGTAQNKDSTTRRERAVVTPDGCLYVVGPNRHEGKYAGESLSINSLTDAKGETRVFPEVNIDELQRRFNGPDGPINEIPTVRILPITSNLNYRVTLHSMSVNPLNCGVPEYEKVIKGLKNTLESQGKLDSLSLEDTK